MMYSITDIVWMLPHDYRYIVHVLDDGTHDHIEPLSWGELQLLIADDYWTAQVKLTNTVNVREDVLALFFKRRGHAETEK